MERLACQMEKYQSFDKLAGRFVSEFGMVAYPSMKTIEKFVPDTSFERVGVSRSDRLIALAILDPKLSRPAVLSLMLNTLPGDP